ncbi:hypothetical protein [Nostoc sp.]|uniref:hypothetical protein n=1 Tax=Nostoc sp. TaxID=1180 RepID=UPI002FF46BEB
MGLSSKSCTNESTEILPSNGYSTLLTGKWHLTQTCDSRRLKLRLSPTAGGYAIAPPPLHLIPGRYNGGLNISLAS